MVHLSFPWFSLCFWIILCAGLDGQSLGPYWADTHPGHSRRSEKGGITVEAFMRSHLSFDLRRRLTVFSGIQMCMLKEWPGPKPVCQENYPGRKARYRPQRTNVSSNVRCLRLCFFVERFARYVPQCPGETPTTAAPTS